MRSFRAVIAGASALSLVACAQPGAVSDGAPETVGQRSASNQRVGDENHPKILAQYGGEIEDARVRAYVNDVGQRLAAQSEQPDARWTFTVLDSPVVNAFALPGGYVYVTRGLIALANDEAEVAGVLGHEIGHVTADHSSQRQSRAGIAQLGVLGATILGAVAGLSGDALQSLGQLGNLAGQGYVASYSRAQEFEADQLGVRYISRAGYDPRAEADFLRQLQAESELQARIAGGSYNANRVDFFASHPATAERVEEAIRAADVSTQPTDRQRSRDAYLEAISGMTYGDSAAQGFVRGDAFIHPDLRFRFTVPNQFRVQNSAAAVTAAGPGGAGLIFDGTRYAGGSMEAYIARSWAPQIAEQARVGRLSNLRTRRIDGLEAASAALPVQTNEGVKVLRMTAIRDGDQVYRFLGVQPNGAGALGEAMDRAAASFDKLSATEAARFTPYRLTTRTVQPGDTAESLARLTPFDDFREERFRVLNGLQADERLEAGQKVKLVVE